MPKLDTFSAQIVSFVRRMPHEAILALVKDHLGLIDAAPSPAAIRTTASRRAAKRQAKGNTKKAARTTKTKAPGSTQRGRRAALVATVEKFVKASKGVGLAEVAKGTGGGKDRVKSVLKELKAAKRIAHAGERKYTRYAANKTTALAASKRARAGR